MNTYYCNHCGKTTKRDSDKRWITSMCASSGYKKTRLWRVIEKLPESRT